jgi:hypothetical protein
MRLPALSGRPEMVDDPTVEAQADGGLRGKFREHRRKRLCPSDVFLGPFRIVEDLFEILFRVGFSFIRHVIAASSQGSYFYRIYD